jgi:hypothetical protein
LAEADWKSLAANFDSKPSEDGAANEPDNRGDGVRRYNVVFCSFTNPFDISENIFDNSVNNFTVLNCAY